ARAYGQVLSVPRQDPLVGGDPHHGEIAPAGPGQHVLDEALVAGDVDDFDGEAVGLFEEGKAEVDGDATRLLFRQAVRVDAGQRLDERGLAVVDVAGGADDDRRGCGAVGARRRWLVRGAEWLRRSFRLFPSRHPGPAAAATAAASALICAGRTVRQSSKSRSSTMRPMAGGLPRRRASSSARALAAVAPS